MARCEACGNECPGGAAFCGACGHRLGVEPEEPVNVTVRVVDSPSGVFGGCLSCLTWVIAVLVVAVLVVWLFSC